MSESAYNPNEVLGTVFGQDMTRQEYAEIFNAEKGDPRFLEMSLDEKVAFRKRLVRAQQVGKIKIHALSVIIDEEMSKADEATKKRLREERKDSPAVTEVKKQAKKMSAIESAAALMGITPEQLALIQQKKTIENFKEKGEKVSCDRHNGQEFEMLSDGVGCRKCQREDKEGICLIHDNFVPPAECNQCKTEKGN